MCTQVCWKWYRIVETTSSLWQRVYINTTAEHDEGYEEACPMPRSVCLPWWVKHSSKLRCVHLKGHAAGPYGSLSMYNIGLITLLNSSSLTVLHLDDCFEDGAAGVLIPILATFVSLTQLHLMSASKSFIDMLPRLCSLLNLKRLELKGMEQGVVKINCAGLPKALEILSLALLDICGWLDSDREPLTNLKVLKLVHVNWQGPLCSHVGCLTNLEEVVLNNVHVENQAEEVSQWSTMYSLKKLRHLEVGGEQDPAFSQRAGEQILQSHRFRDLSKLCLKFQCRSSSYFMNQFSNLSQLYLECFSFRSVPDPIMRLCGLKQLGLVDCELTSFPTAPDIWAKNLKLLDISKNKFPELPRMVMQLTSLTDLSIAHNECSMCGVNFLADLPDLMTLRLLEGESLTLDYGDIDILEGQFRSKSEAFRLGCLVTLLHIKLPHCHLYL